MLLRRTGLLRRCDWVVLIGGALELTALGIASRRIARDLGLAAWLVAGWSRIDPAAA